MHERSATSRARRTVAVALATGCCAFGSAGPAFAQAPLPDTDRPAATRDAAEQKSDLPTTGVEASWLAFAGAALLVSGVFIRPAARRRRTWNTDAWQQAVRSRS